MHEKLKNLYPIGIQCSTKLKCQYCLGWTQFQFGVLGQMDWNGWMDWIGEAFLGRMSIIFYKEIGFSKSDIALYSKGLGWITTVVFTLLGGLFAIRAGVIKAMFVSGILMASTNLLFSVLAWSGKSEWLFAVAVIFDDMAAAFATVAFVAFISMLVDRTYTATQYALLASIGTAGRTTLAASSGAMVDWLNGDWGIFFIITAVMVIPSLICLYLIKNKMNLSER